MEEKKNKYIELRKWANVAFTAAPVVSIPKKCNANDLIAVALLCKVLGIKPKHLFLIITDNPRCAHGINVGIGGGLFDKEDKSSAALVFDYVTAHDLDLYRNKDAYEKARHLIINKDAEFHECPIVDPDITGPNDKPEEVIEKALEDYYSLVDSRLREADGYEKTKEFDSIDEALCAMVREVIK